MDHQDDPQWLMNKAKRDVIIEPLKSKGGSATFADLFLVAEEYHCDVLGAALMSLKRAKVIEYEGMMLLSPGHDDKIITLVKPDYDPFA